MFLTLVFYLTYFGFISITLRPIVDKLAKIYMSQREAFRVGTIVTVGDILVFWVSLVLIAGIVEWLSGSAATVRGYYWSIWSGAQVASFLAAAILYGKIIKYPTRREPIGVKKGLIIAVIMKVVVLFLALVIIIADRAFFHLHENF